MSAPIGPDLSRVEPAVGEEVAPHLWVRFTYRAAFKSTAHEHLSFPLLLCPSNEGSRFCPVGGPWPDLKQPHKDIDNSKMVLSTVKSGPPTCMVDRTIFDM